MNTPYKLRTYEINSHQLKILKEIKSLPQKRLHYVVGQQSNVHKNLTLPEMKKLIRQGLRRYIQETSLHYQTGLENQLVRFFCVFEVKKDFFHSQHQNTLVDEGVDMGIHFHLFITCPDKYPWISFPSLLHSIFNELTSLKHKQLCLSKFDYKKIDKLDDNFILYHTKQFMFRPSVEMLMKN
jgi:hypothetical protein